MPKKVNNPKLPIGTILFWMAVVFTIAAYLYAVPRDQWFFFKEEEITRDTPDYIVRQLIGPNQPVKNPNNQTVRNPNNW